MTAEQIASLGPALGTFLAGFRACFVTKNTFAHLGTYCRGLLSDLPRKSVEPIALAAEGIETVSWLLADYGYNLFADAFFVTEETLADEVARDTVVRFLRATRRGWEDALADPAAAAQIALLERASFAIGSSASASAPGSRMIASGRCAATAGRIAAAIR